MHPAFSVIFLTTLLGAGQGLFLAMFTGQLYAIAGFVPAQDGPFYGLGSFVALFLLVVGLGASFFHLGRPERAWRSAAMWRTSWLSREVIILPALMGLLFIYGLAHWMNWTAPWFSIGSTLEVDATLMFGLLGTIASFALFVSTAMIYASVKFIEEWHSTFTVFNFTLLGLASGFMLAAGYSAYIGSPLVPFFGTWAVVLTIAGFISRAAHLMRNARLQHKSTVQTAIGIRHNAIVQKAQGAMGGSFNTREFFHGRSELTVRMVRNVFLVLVFPVPILLIVIAYLIASTTLPIIAFLIQYVGLIAERWYFFAEAKHPQNLYYQAIS
ncbi:DMSO reductase [Thiocapsa imhoffii]|uniref:DMSO reductase n=1 Tax=Thiocapsa imhoffii TaxID=382777 RepID=A0A9X0WKW3_9GAMM|nr:sulfite dehydrogenase subunit SoeC [Thiocapsa imhoffii]MBK1646391.1 DMSO reductase [Thiocapsa imhoffii]